MKFIILKELHPVLFLKVSPSYHSLFSVGVMGFHPMFFSSSFTSTATYSCCACFWCDCRRSLFTFLCFVSRVSLLFVGQLYERSAFFVKKSRLNKTFEQENRDYKLNIALPIYYVASAE